MRRGALGCFIFLTPKRQKKAKPKKLAFYIKLTIMAFVELRTVALVLYFRFGSNSFHFLTLFYEVLSKNEKASPTLSLTLIQI